MNWLFLRDFDQVNKHIWNVRFRQKTDFDSICFLFGLVLHFQDGSKWTFGDVTQNLVEGRTDRYRHKDKEKKTSERPGVKVRIVQVMHYPIHSSLDHYWCLCWMWGPPESVRAQAQFCGGIQAGTWRWSPAGSTPLSACLGRLPPTSGHAPGCRGPCLGAFDAGPDAGRAGPGDRGLLG